MDHSLKLAKTTLFPFFVFSGGERYFNFDLNQYPQESKAATKQKMWRLHAPTPTQILKRVEGTQECESGSYTGQASRLCGTDNMLSSSPHLCLFQIRLCSCSGGSSEVKIAFIIARKEIM